MFERRVGSKKGRTVYERENQIRRPMMIKRV